MINIIHSDFWIRTVNMARIHPSLCESVTSELDLFSVPAMQTSIEKSQWVEYHLLSSVSESGGHIAYLISGLGNDYVDLAESYLLLSAKIIKENGDNFGVEDTEVGPVN